MYIYVGYIAGHHCINKKKRLVQKMRSISTPPTIVELLVDGNYKGTRVYRQLLTLNIVKLQV